MQNFKITIDDEEQWISRSIGVTAMVLAKNDKNKWCILAIKRGKKSETGAGCWSLPGGYLDYDETLLQGCLRELKEETGIILPPLDFRLHSIDSNPRNFKQNIIVRFLYISNRHTSHFKFKTLSKEENKEIDAIGWIDLDEIDSSVWAFNFDNVLKELKELYV